MALGPILNGLVDKKIPGDKAGEAVLNNHLLHRPLRLLEPQVFIPIA
jgi:hypothetical protein